MRFLLLALLLTQDRVTTSAPKGALPKEGVPHDQFEKLQALIKPKPGGLDEIPWMTSLWEARKKAAEEGKPLFVWAGEGNPLGVT